jgi:hypothetical protein
MNEAARIKVAAGVTSLALAGLTAAGIATRDRAPAPMSASPQAAPVAEASFEGEAAPAVATGAGTVLPAVSQPAGLEDEDAYEAEGSEYEGDEDD